MTERKIDKKAEFQLNEGPKGFKLRKGQRGNSKEPQRQKDITGKEDYMY